MSLVSVEKTDGETLKSIDGSHNYKLFFSLVLSATADIYSNKMNDFMTMTLRSRPFGISYHSDNLISGFRVSTECYNGFNGSRDPSNCDFASKGTRIKYIGEVVVRKTEQNWKVGSIYIKTSSMASASEVQAEESIKRQKQAQEQFEQKKEEFKKSNASESMNTFKADYYKAEQHPIYSDYSIELSDIKLINKNIGFDFKTIQLAFQRGFTNHARIKRIYSTVDSPIAKIIFEVVDIQSKHSSGTKLLSKETYSGFEVTGNFRLRVYTLGNEIITEEWSLKGGNPYSNHSEQDAFSELEKNIMGSTNSIIYSLFTFASKINAITKENDKEVKRVYLSNADLVPDKYLMYFVVVEKKDYTILPNGKEDVKNIIATLEKKSIEEGQIDCKVTSGGKNLKELFKSGKEYLVLSSRAKPKDVE